MSIIEEIKRDYEDFVPHDDECDIYLTLRMKPACNCSRRRKIAWLERLEEPTDKMVTEGMVAIMNCTDPDSDEQQWAEQAYKAMLTAASEEDL